MNLLWLQSGGCGGCTMSLLCSEARDPLGQFRDAGIDLLWHPALSEPTAAEALDLLEGCAAGRTPVDILCIEGAMLRGPHGSGRFHRVSGIPQIHKVYPFDHSPILNIQTGYDFYLIHFKPP